MKVFTMTDGSVREGAEVGRKELKNGLTIPVVSVGEEGRGRQLGFLPVQLQSHEQAAFNRGEQIVLRYCSLSKTQKGGIKLVSESGSSDKLQALIVNLTGIGFRGSNEHSGDAFADGYFPLETEAGGEVKHSFKILCEGLIAQGDAGRMGSGTQYIAIADAGKVFRSKRTGRLYDQEGEHFYMFDGHDLLVATWEERVASEIF